MTPTPTLSQRLAAHPRFRWEPGMLDDYGRRAAQVEDEIWMISSDFCAADLRYDLSPRAENSPDLSDHATTGILLSWLPEATVLLSYGCDPVVEVGGTTYSGDTLGEAVAEALLAQWGAE